MDKFKKFLIFVFCTIFIIISLFSTIFANGELHEDNCETANCQICAVMNIVEEFARNAMAVALMSILSFSIIIILALTKEKMIQVRGLTLVELKVIQNK